MRKQKEVEDWLSNYENPMKPVVLKLREIILNADNRIDECIKWQAPTFFYKGNMASFFPKSKKHALTTGCKGFGNNPTVLLNLMILKI